MTDSIHRVSVYVAAALYGFSNDINNFTMDSRNTLVFSVYSIKVVAALMDLCWRKMVIVILADFYLGQKA